MSSEGKEVNEQQITPVEPAEREPKTEPQAPTPDNKGVWGAWPTLGLGLGIGFAAITVQTIATLPFAVVRIASNPRQDPFKLADELMRDGLLLSVSSILFSLALTVLVFLAVKLRRGKPIREYLALRQSSPRAMFAALGAAVLLAGLIDYVSGILGRPAVPKFMVDVYRTSVFVPLLWFWWMGAAPVAEEVFFRGFLMEGFRLSRMGSVGAVVVTALMWASLHLQYDAFDIGGVVLLGLLLGAVRIRSRSLWPCIAMHVLWNVISTVGLVLYIQRGGS